MRSTQWPTHFDVLRRLGSTPLACAVRCWQTALSGGVTVALHRIPALQSLAILTTARGRGRRIGWLETKNGPGLRKTHSQLGDP